MHHGPPKELEKQRIKEIKALSYKERMYRFFAILKASHTVKNSAANNPTYKLDFE